MHTHSLSLRVACKCPLALWSSQKNTMWFHLCFRNPQRILPAGKTPPPFSRCIFIINSLISQNVLMLRYSNGAHYHPRFNLRFLSSLLFLVSFRLFSFFHSFVSAVNPLCDVSPPASRSLLLFYLLV